MGLLYIASVDIYHNGLRQLILYGAIYLVLLNPRSIWIFCFSVCSKVDIGSIVAVRFCICCHTSWFSVCFDFFFPSGFPSQDL